MKNLSMKSQWESMPSDGDPAIRERIWRRIKLRLGLPLRILQVAAVAAVLSILFFSLRPHFSTPVEKASPQSFVVTTPLGTKTSLALPDGTVIIVNAGSTLSYTSDFNIKNRDVTLNGEAYFEVEKNPQIPFRVITPGGVFSVLGTKFNITSYEEDRVVMGALLEGSLRFDNNGESRQIQPGELLKSHNGVCEIEQVDALQYCSWTTGRIKYDNISLRDLCKRLSRAYHTDIILTSDNLAERRIRVSFTQDDSIDTIMKTLGVIFQFRVDRTEKAFYIYE